MTVQEFYEKTNGNYEGALKRLKRDEMIQMFLKMFLQDDSYEKLLDAVERGDIDAAFGSAHTLKGVSANIELTQLHEAVCELVEQLRPKQEQADAELMARVKEKYESTVKAIREVS